MVHLSKDTRIREIQIGLLKCAKRLKYPDEYKEATQESVDFVENLYSKLPANDIIKPDDSDSIPRGGVVLPR